MKFRDNGYATNLNSIDTVGVHYSATLWRWYRNWVGNAQDVNARYGQRWYRVRFLYSSLMADQH